MKQSLPLIALLAAVPAFAEGNRQLDAHEHGVGELNIAIDGTTVAMEFHAPGADIVGFEYEAESDQDLAAIDTALVTLSAPLELFVMPAAAACSVTAASAELESEEAHADDDHDDHDHDKEHEDHDEDEHAEHDHEDHDDDKHDNDDHAEHDHDKEHEKHEDDAEHAEHDHDDHDGHDDHAEEAGHTEFHAEYTLTCTNPSALTEIDFAYFETFENALEVEVQVITSAGAQAFEVERDDPKLDLGSLF